MIVKPSTSAIGLLTMAVWLLSTNLVLTNPFQCKDQAKSHGMCFPQAYRPTSVYWNATHVDDPKDPRVECPRGDIGPPGPILPQNAKLVQYCCGANMMAYAQQKGDAASSALKRNCVFNSFDP